MIDWRWQNFQDVERVLRESARSKRHGERFAIVVDDQERKAAALMQIMEMAPLFGSCSPVLGGAGVRFAHNRATVRVYEGRDLK